MLAQFVRRRAATQSVVACSCRQIQRRLLLGGGRGFCSGPEPPRPPSYWRHFAPRLKGSGGASSKKKGDAKAGGEASEGGGGGGSGGGGGPSPELFRLGSLAGVALGLVAFNYADFKVGGPQLQEISMQHFLSNLLAAGRVSKLVVVNGTQVKVVLGEPAQASELHGEGMPSEAQWSGGAGSEGGGVVGGSGAQPTYYFTIGSIESFEEKLEAAQAELGVVARDYVAVQYVAETSWLSEAGRFVPTLLLIGFFFMLSRGAAGLGGMGGGGAGGIFNVGKSKAVKAKNVSTKFADVAGLHEAKAEIMEFVDILQNPERYTKLGAKIPKGALLVGPPGCGKTLLAKATAGEARAPFYSISGSDFIEMFVGVGPSRVRDLFAQARANAPCLIFIDEIDAVGRARGKGGFSGGNDERENTLNALLIELDGFSPSTGIVVLAGTNRPDVLDSALLRPGRFDRQVVVDKPDIKGREEIFGVHLEPLKLAEGETIKGVAKKLAGLTPGFSGAEVANVCNEAALIAARWGAAAVDAKSFDAAVDRVIAGLEKKNLVIDAHERRVIAFHEAGHALVGWVLQHADPVMKVSIVPRGRAALGYSQSLPRDVALHTAEQLGHTMAMAMGGRAAEEVVFEEISSGAQNDIQRVTQMAQQQVAVFGMSDIIGPLSFDQGGESNTLYRPFSEQTQRMIDVEVEGLVKRSYDHAIDVLREHKEKLHALAEALLEKEVIGSEELISILGPRPNGAPMGPVSFMPSAADEPPAAEPTPAPADPAPPIDEPPAGMPSPAVAATRIDIERFRVN